MNGHDTTDLVIFAVIAIVIAFIVYESANAIESVTNALGSWTGPVLFGGVAVVGFLAFIIFL